MDYGLREGAAPAWTDVDGMSTPEWCLEGYNCGTLGVLALLED
jgi:hypothetical protein